MQLGCVIGMNHYGYPHIALGAKRQKEKELSTRDRLKYLSRHRNCLINSSSRQSSLKMPRCSPIGHALFYLVQNLSYEKWVWFTQRWACRWSSFSYQWFHTKNHFDTETKDNSKMAYSPYHLEDMVNEDDIDLLLHSSDIHGIPRLNESQHFDGHPRAVWLYDSISPPLQEFPPVKYNRANYYHSTNPRSNVV